MSEARIEFDAVTVVLDGREIVSRVNLAVQPGQFIALVGPNGSGKSTLLRQLAGIRGRRSGRVLLDGREVSSLRGAERAHRIGVLSQASHAPDTLTVGELVEIGIRAGSIRSRSTRSRLDAAIDEALHEAGIGEEYRSRPLGTLSGGERQRTLYAQAVARSPDVLVLDEPTNHLDVRHQHDILARVARSGRTALAALHTLDLAVSYADDIAILDRGRLFTSGQASTSLTTDALQRVFGVEGEYIQTSRGSRLVIHGASLRHGGHDGAAT